MQVSTYLVKEAFNHDKDNVTLKAMPRLTASHLDPNGFEKMRVSLAFQLFGDHVLRCLYHYKGTIESSYGKGAIDALEAIFRMMNELIKVMTSRFKSEALCPNSKGAAALSNFFKYITNWEQHAVNGVGFISKSTAVGFRVTLSSILSLLQYVTKGLQYQYLMTAKLSQYPVENLFEIVRQSSGCNDHLTPEQFLITVNCLSFYSSARPVCGSSVEQVVLTALLDTGDVQLQQASLQETIEKQMALGDLGSLYDAACQEPTFPIEHHSLVQRNSNSRLVYHMAGYVAKKCVEMTGCDTFRALLLVPASEGTADTQSAFTSFFDKGGLLYPSKELFEFVNYLEGVFTGCFSMNRQHADSILDVLSFVMGKDKIIRCAAHEAEVKAKIIDLQLLVLSTRMVEKLVDLAQNQSIVK
ncbi:uncharacterized protein LOC142768359 [Rhipicephalus microplus]|uniref:uncharacterized protein LOC142768359 n=1 Tax=Rhipicephalus microplus TaxID=6941 RepID=UPI003F6AFA74